LASESLLTQVIANIISNAVKFVAPGTRPKLKLFTERRGDKVRLWVEDNGIGIAKRDQERIFDLFTRLHSTSAYEGTGIGLAVVHRALKRMGGTVGVESEEGKGSRFWIELKSA
jgi:signal transduction histidine kinase